MRRQNVQNRKRDDIRLEVRFLLDGGLGSDIFGTLGIWNEICILRKSEQPETCAVTLTWIIRRKKIFRANDL
jgi:hypothetical protein